SSSLALFRENSLSFTSTTILNPGAPLVPPSVIRWSPSLPLRAALLATKSVSSPSSLPSCATYWYKSSWKQKPLIWPRAASSLRPCSTPSACLISANPLARTAFSRDRAESFLSSENSTKTSSSFPSTSSRTVLSISATTPSLFLGSSALANLLLGPTWLSISLTTRPSIGSKCLPISP